MSRQKYCETLKMNIEKQLSILSKKYKITKKDRNAFIDSINISIPLRKKTILSYDQKCKARKQDGTQCSRRHKNGELFCGKHIHNQKYGIYKLVESKNEIKSDKIGNKPGDKTGSVESPKIKSKRGRKPKKDKQNKSDNKDSKDDNNYNDFLTLKSVQIKNKYYYIDKHNILYNPEPINGQYEIIGKLKNNINNDIYYATSLS